ncbi:MAG: hypothetical protein ABL903_16835 [Methylococcales bacterium]
MKKFILPLASTVLIAELVAGCVSTPAGPSVGSLGAGSDSAYINASRGRADAQMTAAQAEQYRRQQAIVSEEMDLEQKKRANTLNNTNGLLQGIGTIMQMTR